MEKSLLLSKTFWFGLITAIVPLFPAAQQVIVDNPQAFGMIWGALTVVLRYVTKDKVILLG